MSQTESGIPSFRQPAGKEPRKMMPFDDVAAKLSGKIDAGIQFYAESTRFFAAGGTILPDMQL
ncbi:MAG TPA: hypothetical protein PLK63_12205 [Catalimonadaceae bacterium]|nr:hypothetical protein [Catalimonadaceae bacterium]